MNDNRIGPKSGIQACTGSSRGHPPQFVGAAGLPAGLYAARGDPLVSCGARGHPLLSSGPGVDLPERFKARVHQESPTGARGHPELSKARDHPVAVTNNRINSSEDGLVLSTLACFLEPDGRGMSFYQLTNAVRSGDADRLEVVQESKAIY